MALSDSNFWPRANIFFSFFFFLFVLWLHNVPVMGLGFVKDGQSTVDGRAVRESHKREPKKKNKIIQWLLVSFLFVRHHSQSRRRLLIINVV